MPKKEKDKGGRELKFAAGNTSIVTKPSQNGRHRKNKSEVKFSSKNGQAKALMMQKVQKQNMRGTNKP